MSIVGATEFTENLRPGFVGDYLSREHVLPGGVKLDASTFINPDAVAATVLAAGADDGDVAIPVVALSGAIPSGTVLDFGGAKFARLTAAAVAGDEELTVSELPTTLIEDDVAYYAAPGMLKRVPAGTPVYADISELEGSAASGLLWKSAANGVTVDPDTDVVRIVAYDVVDVDGLDFQAGASNDAALLRKGTLVYVNNMYWDTLDSTVQVHIRNDYEVSVTTPGQEVSDS